MKKLIKLLTVLIIIFSAGCVTSIPVAQMQKEVENFELPKLPEKGKAIVYVVRPGIIGLAIKFNVFIDDKEAQSEMGYTKGKEYIYFNLEAGKHTILSKAENWAKIEVDAKAGEIIFIQQNPAFGFIMARNNLESLENYQGKYYVKTLSEGFIKKSDK